MENSSNRWVRGVGGTLSLQYYFSGPARPIGSKQRGSGGMQVSEWGGDWRCRGKSESAGWGSCGEERHCGVRLAGLCAAGKCRGRTLRGRGRARRTPNVVEGTKRGTARETQRGSGVQRVYGCGEHKSGRTGTSAQRTGGSAQIQRGRGSHDWRGSGCHVSVGGGEEEHFEAYKLWPSPLLPRKQHIFSSDQKRPKSAE